MRISIALALVALVTPCAVNAQAAPPPPAPPAAAAPPPAPPAAQKSLAATLNVYVFPGAGQTPTQQSQDENECYHWAVQNTGSDPFEAAKQAEAAKQQAAAQKQQAAQATKGAAVK